LFDRKAHIWIDYLLGVAFCFHHIRYLSPLYEDCLKERLYLTFSFFLVWKTQKQERDLSFFLPSFGCELFDIKEELVEV